MFSVVFQRHTDNRWGEFLSNWGKMILIDFYEN